MKKIFFLMVTLIFTLGVSTLALQAGETGQSIAHRDARLTINSFGEADDFHSGTTPSRLVQASQFVSVNDGPVELVSAKNYKTDCSNVGPFLMSCTPLMVIDEQRSDRTVSYSAVQRNQGDLLIEFYNTLVDNGEGTMDWYIEVYMNNTSDRELTVCYYPYINLDATNVATADSGSLSFRITYPSDVLFEVAPELTSRNPIPTLRPDSFEMKHSPQLRIDLENAESCIALPNAERQLKGGDFTGALRYKTNIAAGNLAHADFRVSRLQ